jgi:hypothetical protein
MDRRCLVRSHRSVARFSEPSSFDGVNSALGGRGHGNKESRPAIGWFSTGGYLAITSDVFLKVDPKMRFEVYGSEDSTLEKMEIVYGNCASSTSPGAGSADVGTATWTAPLLSCSSAWPLQRVGPRSAE